MLPRYPCYLLPRYLATHATPQPMLPCYPCLPATHATPLCCPASHHTSLFICRLQEQLDKPSVNMSERPIKLWTPPGRTEGRNHPNSANHRRRSPSPSERQRVVSPTRDEKCRRTSYKPEKFFQLGGAELSSSTLSACTICLGRHRHDIFTCASSTLWDKSTTHCYRNSDGCLVNPQGNILCSNWQRPNSCNSTTHYSRHECSGCGKKDHGAQRCPWGQKA